MAPIHEERMHGIEEIAPKIGVAESKNDEQSGPPADRAGGEVQTNVRSGIKRRQKRAREYRSPKKGLPARPQFQPFAEALRAAMEKKGVSASELARQLWGTTVDNRGYTVAKHRDRVTHYLKGALYPELEVLEAIASYLGVEVSVLALPPGPGVPPLRHQGPPLNAPPWQMQAVPNAEDKVRIQLDKVVSRAEAMRLFDLLMQFAEGERSFNDDLLGRAIPGGKTDNGENGGSKAA